MLVLEQDVLRHLSREELDGLHAKTADFYQSVKLSLAIVKKDLAWKPLYFQAEYDHLPSESFFKRLFDAPRFCIVSERMDIDLWEGIEGAIVPGGAGFPVYFEPTEHTPARPLQVSFEGKWQRRGPSFETGLDARLGWNHRWPRLLCEYEGETMEPDLWTLMQNVADINAYNSISEVINDKFGFSKDKFRFEANRLSRGLLVYPIFTSFESASYARERQKVRLVARVVYHSKQKPENICISARIEPRDEDVERLEKSHVATGKTQENLEKELLVSSWESVVKAPAPSIVRSNLSLSCELTESLSLQIDEWPLKSVPELTSRLEINKIMTEKATAGRNRALDYFLKIEKMLLGLKGDEFEEAMFMLLCRLGFEVAWQHKNDPVDIVALSPNGCLVVGCTSAPPTVAMAEDLVKQAQSYRNENNPVVMPVLALNQTDSSDLSQDLQKMQQEEQICFLTKDKLRSLFDVAREESSDRTERYLSRHFRS
jgi:hypothetical protein